MNSVNSKFQITEKALGILNKVNTTEEELEWLFENEQFSPELEEYLFKCMDESKVTYLEVVIEELMKLRLLRHMKTLT